MADDADAAERAAKAARAKEKVRVHSWNRRAPFKVETEKDGGDEQVTSGCVRADNVNASARLQLKKFQAKKKAAAAGGTASGASTPTLGASDTNPLDGSPSLSSSATLAVHSDPAASSTPLSPTSSLGDAVAPVSSSPAVEEYVPPPPPAKKLNGAATNGRKASGASDTGLPSPKASR